MSIWCNKNHVKNYFFISIILDVKTARVTVHGDKWLCVEASWTYAWQIFQVCWENPGGTWQGENLTCVSEIADGQNKFTSRCLFVCAFFTRTF